MSSPVNVTVTGAAGQIGYALLFRIASGRDARLGHRGRACDCSRSPTRSRRPRAPRWSSSDCAFPLLRGIDISDDPKQAFDGANIALLVGARPAVQGHGARGPARGERRDLQAAGRGAQRARCRRRQGAGGRQPRQHQLPDRDVARARRPARALHGDDARSITTGRSPSSPTSSERPVTDIKRDDGLGQPLDRPSTRTWSTRRSTAARAWTQVDDEVWIAEEFIPTRRQARRRDHRGPRSLQRGARPRTPRSTMSTTGCSARPTSDWVSMGVPSDGSYGVDEGLISARPVSARAASGSWSRGSRSPTSRASGSMRPSPSSRTSATRSSASD